MNERESHMDQVERWAHFVRNNPHKWKKFHTEFINAIFEKHDQFRKRLLNTPEGKKKLKELYGTKSKEGDRWLKS
jgi:uncharacterized protein YeaO (DUF488 family)